MDSRFRGNDKRDGHDKGRRCLADARHDKKKVGMTRRVIWHDDFTVIPDSFLPVIPDLIGDPGFYEDYGFPPSRE
jgi:hypothetical protein